METIDLSILGELRLNKIDYILEDICKLRDSVVWSIGSGLLKNLGAMDFDPLLQSGSFGLFSSHTAYNRGHGNLAVISALLEFVGNNNNSEILSRVAYGMGDSGTLNSNGDLSNTTQLNLGLLSSFLDLGDIGDSCW